MNKDIRKILLNVNFFDKYKKIIEEYPESEKGFENYSIEIVSNIIGKLGYNYKYFKSENFFRVFELIHNYNFWIHISLRYGLVDLMLYVKLNNKILTPCGSFNWLVLDIGLSELPLPLPCFTNYDELNEILVKGFAIYEDFKKKFLQGGNTSMQSNNHLSLK
jgi:hypothetical protein